MCIGMVLDFHQNQRQADLGALHARSSEPMTHQLVSHPQIPLSSMLQARYLPTRSDLCERRLRYSYQPYKGHFRGHRSHCLDQRL